MNSSRHARPKSAPDQPPSRIGRVDVLVVGRVGAGGVASTVSLVRDGDIVMVIDPGMVRDRSEILKPLVTLGVTPEGVTDIVLSHHHPDHTINAALFTEARVHDHWATYFRDTWTDHPADGRVLSPSVRLITTPGHTSEDITTLVGTADGIVAFTHLWWSADGPAEDPLAIDMAALHIGRARVLDVADRIVPGHGAPFTPNARTPR